MCDLCNCDNGPADKYLSSEECEVLEFRFEFPIKCLCKKHYQEHFNLYALHNGRKCCDPRKNHKKMIKTNLSEVSLEFAKAVRDKTEYRVIPGKRLCLHCQIFLKDLIATVDSDEENDENIPE